MMANGVTIQASNRLNVATYHLNMADRLVALLRHYPVQAEVIHTGRFCEERVYDSACAYLHVLRAGKLTVRAGVHETWTVTEPTVLFYPSPVPHALSALSTPSAKLYCATVRFAHQSLNPLVRALPSVLRLPLAEVTALDASLSMLFAEAEGRQSGWQAVANRLFEVVLIQFLRHLLDAGQINTGLLAGLADSRLAKAIAAVHEAPERPWTLGTMAHASGMSRARFAARFHDIVGIPPGRFLSQWRVGLACTLLLEGKSVAVVADTVGYGSATTLARAFRVQFGCSPREWLCRHSP